MYFKIIVALKCSKHETIIVGYNELYVRIVERLSTEEFPALPDHSKTEKLK